MIAYEFYCLDSRGRYQIIGILPERREKAERVDQESVMSRGRQVFGEHFNTKDMFFIQVTINDDTVRPFQPIPTSITLEKIWE
jgi:hypothetical protein